MSVCGMALRQAAGAAANCVLQAEAEVQRLALLAAAHVEHRSRPSLQRPLITLFFHHTPVPDQVGHPLLPWDLVQGLPRCLTYTNFTTFVVRQPSCCGV